MTVIAYDWNVLAADSAFTHGDDMAVQLGHKIGTATLQSSKRWIGEPDLAWVGISGAPAGLYHVLDWLQDGDPDSELVLDDNTEALIITRSHGVYLFAGDRPCRLHDGIPVALGSGGAIALGAMMAGAPAQQAVDITCAIDQTSKAPIQAIQIAVIEEAETEKPPVHLAVTVKRNKPMRERKRA